MFRQLKINENEIQWKLRFCIVGLLLMIISLHRSKILEMENVGGFFALLQLVLYLSILGLGLFLILSKNRITKPSINITLDESSVSKIIFAIIIGSFAFGALFYWATNRYDFLKDFLFLSGGAISYVSIISLFEKTLKIKFPQSIISSVKSFDKHIVFLIILGITIFFSFHKNLYGDLIRLDDLLMIDAIKNVDNPLLFLSRPVEWQSHYYRPFFAVQNWFYYNFFGFNYFYYQLNLLFQHLISTVLLYFGLYQLSRKKLSAFLGALIFSTSFFVATLVVWVSDTMMLTGVFLGLILILIINYKDGFLWYLSLFLALFLVVLNRENGAAIIAAVAFWSLFSKFSRTINLKQFGKILTACIAATLLYLVLRGYAVGFIFPEAGGSTGYFFRFLESAAERNLLGFRLYLYTVAGNLTNVFLPVLDGEGVLIMAQLVVAVLCLGATMVVLSLCRKYSQNKILSSWLNFLSILTVFLLSYYVWNMISQLEIYELGGPVGTKTLISFVFHSVLSSILIFVAIKVYKTMPKDDLALGSFALGLIFFGGLVAFPYFRWRSLYIGVYGWIILLILCLKSIENQRGSSILTTSIFMIGISLAFFNGHTLNSWGPAITIEEADILCDARVSRELAYEIAEFHDLDKKQIVECEK